MSICKINIQEKGKFLGIFWQSPYCKINIQERSKLFGIFWQSPKGLLDAMGLAAGGTGSGGGSSRWIWRFWRQILQILKILQFFFHKKNIAF